MAALMVACHNAGDNESAVAEKGIEVHGDTLCVAETSPIANKIVEDTGFDTGELSFTIGNNLSYDDELIKTIKY